MSDKNIDQAPAEESAEVPVEEHPVEQRPIEETPGTAVPDETAPDQPARHASSAVAWLAFLVSVVALAAAGYTAWTNWQLRTDTSAADDIARLDSQLSAAARSIADLETRVTELSQRDPGIDAALDSLRREFDERARLLESVPSRMSTLESSVASLAGISEGARDAWILAESEYYMQIANAQLQLANNPHLATLALRMADERIVQLSDPRLTDVRRAISDELAALDVMEKPDIEGATLTLASLARVVESLPLAGTAEPAEEEAETDPELGGVGRAWASVKNAFGGLVKVTPVDEAQLVQLSPDAEYFLRNNIALQLQAARLALLRSEQVIFEQTLDDTNALLNEHFDTSSAQVASALQTIAEVRGYVFATEVPDISGSLRLLRQFRTLSESAQ
jgi:uroporphyrin-3 C-methyltransferase